MKKRIFAILTAVLLCAACGFAQAEKVYGTALIRAGGNGKVHLRQERTINSASLGLYYSGTEVTVLSDPEASWIKVGIGTSRGYMHSDYLVYGEEADAVVPAWPVGVRDAESSVNMRKGPSKKYELVDTIAGGQEVAILGETQNRWYYVLADGKTGYVSSGLLKMTDRKSAAVRATLPWKTAYQAYLTGQGDIGATYGLIYVNSDDTPELVINSGVEAGGCLILTYDGQSVDVLQTARLGFTYIERMNLLSNSDGSQGMYYDDVYTIRAGKWTQIFDGNYFDITDGWSEPLGRYICKTYMISGEETTMDAYLEAYRAVYNEKRALSAETPYSFDQMMDELR